VLVSRLRHVAAVGRGVGADLAVPVHCHGRDAAAAFRDPLLAEGAVGAGEDLVGLECGEAREREVHAGLGPQAGVSREQDGELVLDRNLEWVARDRVRPLALRRRLGRERRLLRDRRLGLGNGERARQRRLGIATIGAAHGGEAPRATHPHAHADALALARVELVECPVAGGEALHP
jgi:hypothetical protein